MRQAIVATALLLTGSVTAAQPAGRGERPAAERQEAREATPELFAERHGVTREELEKLRREDGMSWSDIGHALAISERAKRPLAEIVGRKRAGESWRDISGRYQLEYSEVRQGARRMEREARDAGLHDRRHEGRQEREMRRERDGMTDERGVHERSREREHSPRR